MAGLARRTHRGADAEHGHGRNANERDGMCATLCRAGQRIVRFHYHLANEDNTVRACPGLGMEAARWWVSLVEPSAAQMRSTDNAKLDALRSMPRGCGVNARTRPRAPNTPHFSFHPCFSACITMALSGRALWRVPGAEQS